MLLSVCHGTATAQTALDRADPTIVTRNVPTPAPLPVERPRPIVPGTPATTVEVAAIAAVDHIVIEGAEEIERGAFDAAVAPFARRTLSREDLRALAGAVARAARARGYLFATASIPAQPLGNGTLRVAIDEGRVDAARVLGGHNAAVDRLLATLVTHRAARRTDVERVLLLVGDVPGISVQGSRFVREGGFGILLVTIGEDRASGYLQFDNRGTREVGRLRSTALANLRGVIVDGDEIGLIALNTPTQPREFAYVGARYAAPVGRSGDVMTLSASYGRSNPGASLRRFDVIGHSVEGAVSYSTPLVRSRNRSVWASITARRLEIDQSVLGTALRDDRLTTLTLGVNGDVRVAGGRLRGEGGVTAGLPLFGVTRHGEALASRADGDARFVLASLSADWSRRLAGPFSLRLALAAQLASRPLLATAEIGLGGPLFARGYDYSERTGDQGVLGAAEVSIDLGKVPEILDRLQAYLFVDGGYVGNLRDGPGGGGLTSAGLGLRLGRGALDSGVELALPLTGNRFDTGDRSPRGSIRVGLRL